MKRWFIALLLLAAFLLTACGVEKDREDEQTDSGTETVEQDEGKPTPAAAQPESAPDFTLQIVEDPVEDTSSGETPSSGESAATGETEQEAGEDSPGYNGDLAGEEDDDF